MYHITSYYKNTHTHTHTHKHTRQLCITELYLTVPQTVDRNSMKALHNDYQLFAAVEFNLKIEAGALEPSIYPLCAIDCWTPVCICAIRN